MTSGSKSKTYSFKTKRKSESLELSTMAGIMKSTNIISKNGYRSALFTSNSIPDYIYYEASMEGCKGFARVGVATESAEINGPIGMDENGYSFGSKNGYGFHKGRRIRMGERFGNGDIVSCLVKPEESCKIVKFYINGIQIPKFFRVSKEITFWPAFSVCQKCILNINLGPFFSYEDKIKAVESL